MCVHVVMYLNKGIAVIYICVYLNKGIGRLCVCVPLVTSCPDTTVIQCSCSVLAYTPAHSCHPVNN